MIIRPIDGRFRGAGGGVVTVVGVGVLELCRPDRVGAEGARGTIEVGDVIDFVV